MRTVTTDCPTTRCEKIAGRKTHAPRSIWTDGSVTLSGQLYAALAPVAPMLTEEAHATVMFASTAASRRQDAGRRIPSAGGKTRRGCERGASAENGAPLAASAIGRRLSSSGPAAHRRTPSASVGDPGVGTCDRPSLAEDCSPLLPAEATDSSAESHAAPSHRLPARHSNP